MGQAVWTALMEHQHGLKVGKKLLKLGSAAGCMSLYCKPWHGNVAERKHSRLHSHDSEIEGEGRVAFCTAVPLQLKAL